MRFLIGVGRSDCLCECSVWFLLSVMVVVLCVDFCLR